METHASILAWKIPWTKEPGGLQSIRSQSQTQLSTVCVVLQSENPAMEGQNFSFLFDLDWCDRFPGGSDGKATSCNAGDLGSILGSGRSPGEGNGNPLPYSCLENPMDGGAWWATVHGVAKSQT